MKGLIFLFLIFFSNFEALAFNINVNLHYENTKLLKDVRVCFWEKKSLIYSDKPSFCVSSDEKGNADIDLPSGEYYVFAEKKLANKYLFGFYGLNPLNVSKSKILNINLIDYPDVFIKKTKFRGIKGKVLYKGQPIREAEVLVYIDTSTEFKGPPFQYAKSDEKGEFNIPLEEGSYYLFVKKKREPFGPPKVGDLVAFFPQFPIIIKGKEGYELSIEMMKVSEKISQSFNKLIRIYGNVKDKKGAYLKNVYVVAYNTSETLGKPKYISSLTDQEGRFSIFIKEAGRYYLVVRKNLGDTPDIDDVYVYGEIEIKDEDDKKIDIITDFDS
ncbi:MAG: hypothetical protein N2202_01115 [Proteobacteria bacterium]|nr:hypothetical protein [Pseudomonadota bacterium]